MISFLHTPLLWALPLVGVPVLIHLINMLRHRRVQWAAMEFLLISQKKNRTWILFKQLLLLLLRMAAVAAVVCAVAQPLLRNELGILIGGSKTHHIVLLDDSFSMSDRWADTGATAEAKAVVERIGATAANRSESQTFTLLRFSKVGRTGRPTEPDLLQETVDSEFTGKLHKALGAIEVSESSAGPMPALDAIAKQFGETEDENRVVYIVSDFRSRHWNEPEDLRAKLASLTSAGAVLNLINCVDATRPNLAITKLEPAGGTRAAGVPLRMEVTVRNFSPTPARDVSVVLEADGQARPAVKIDQISPGGSAQERFELQFPVGGDHRITARLEHDAVQTDNYRHAVVSLPPTVPVLVIDGVPEAPDAKALAGALMPGLPNRTGLNPRIETPRFLSVQPLDSFDAIYLANVDRLDASALDALQRYVSGGGGLAVFLGPACRVATINEQYYRDGKGFFPMPVEGQAELFVDRVEKTPDLDVTNHPIFKIFEGERNSYLATVNVERYFAVKKGWKPEPKSGTRILARLRNGAPLAVEREIGRGRVIAWTTTAAPTWNNWGQSNPSYLVTMLEMQAYLARRPDEALSRQVGQPLELRLPPGKYQPRLRFTTPRPETVASPTIDAVPRKDAGLAATFLETDVAGVYSVELSTTDGQAESRHFAFNVDTDESDLAALDGPALARNLEGVPFQYKQASGFQSVDSELGGYNLGDAVLYLLILMLVGEQLLAYSCSYHPPTPKTAQGGVS